MKKIKESLNEEEDMGQVDISEVVWKMDKWMPEDDELQNQYYSIIDSEESDEDKIEELEEFFNTHANDRLDSYLGDRSVKEIAQYVLTNELSESQILESEKFDEMPNDELIEIHQDDPQSKDGVFAKTELKRRKEVNGEDVNENDGGYPAGAANDPDAPYNQGGPTHTPPATGEINYKAVWKNEELIILQDEEGDYWLLNHYEIPKSDWADHSEDIPIEYEEDEDGWAHGMDDDYLDNWVPDLGDMESGINFWVNQGTLELGEGLDDWENEIGLIKIDDEMLEELDLPSK